MRKLLWVLLCSSALAQITVVAPIPNANVTVWQFPGTSTTNCLTAGSCTLATTYTDQTLTQTCPSNAQVTLATSNVCQAVADSAGNFGFWVVPGIYQYCLSAAGTQSSCWNVTLNSTSLPSQPTIQPTSLAFSPPAYGIGATSPPLAVTITAGLSALGINSITVSNAEFAQTNNCPALPMVLGPGQFCTINNTFTPAFAGNRAGTLIINTTAGITNIPETGTGSSNPVSLTSITVAPSTSTCALPCQQQETATCNYNNGNSTTPCLGLGWSSSNTGLATVSQTGLVTGVAAGTPTITASSGIYTASGACSNTAPSASSLLVACIGPQNSGDALVVKIAAASAFTVSSITDAAGNVYVDSGLGVVNGNGIWQQMYIANGITASVSNTITITFSGTVTDPDAMVVEYDGIATTSPVDATHNATHAAGAQTQCSDTITTTTTDLIVAFCTVITNSANAAGTGYTFRYADAFANGVEDGVFVASGATGVTFGLSGDTAWLMTEVALKTIAGSATPTFTGAAPTNFYANPSTGNDANGCTNPTTDVCATIKRMQAVSVSAGIGAHGTVLHAAPGTYTEVASGHPSGTSWTVAINMSQGGVSLSRMLRLQCDGFQTCLIRPGSSLAGSPIVVLGDASFMEIVGFDIGGNSNVNASIGGIFLRCDQQGTPPNCQGTSQSLHAYYNLVHNLASTASDGHGTGCIQSGAIEAGSHGYTMVDAQMIGNTVHDYGAGATDPNFCNFTHALYMATQNGIIYSNLVYNITTMGIQVYDSGCGTRIANNTIDNTGGPSILIGGGVNCTPGFNEVINNLVSRDRQQPLMSSGGMFVSQGNPSCTNATPNYWYYNTGVLNNNGGLISGFGPCDNQQSMLNPGFTLAQLYTNAAGGNYTPTSFFAQSTQAPANSTCGSGITSPCVPLIDAQGCAITIPGSIRGALQVTVFPYAACIPNTWPWI